MLPDNSGTVQDKAMGKCLDSVVLRFPALRHLL